MLTLLACLRLCTVCIDVPSPSPPPLAPPAPMFAGFEDNTFALRLASLLDTSSSAIRDQMTVCNVVGGRTVVTVGGFQAATFNMTRLQLPRATRADLLGVDVLIIATSLADGGTLGLHFYLNNSANDDYVPVGPAPVCIA
jgi:hypothetical protein